MPVRKPYPTDVSHEEWSFAAHYLVPVRQNVSQRKHADLREVLTLRSVPPNSPYLGTAY
jgi:hypothetical protein